MTGAFERESLTNSILRNFFISGKRSAPAIEKRGGGVIFRIADGRQVHQDANSTYGRARGVQISVAENLARSKNIWAPCVCPGIIWGTPAVWEEPIKPAAQWLGSPIDSAYASLYLSSDASNWLTV